MVGRRLLLGYFGGREGLKRRRRIGSSHLSRYPRVGSRGCDVTNVDDDEHKRSYCSDDWPCEIPAEEPWFVNWQGKGFFNWRKRKRDNLPAIGADGEVREGLLSLVRRQGVFDEGA